MKFDPAVAELNAMVESTKNITAVDLKDRDTLAIVRENRIALKKARVQISKIGKELRQEAVDFQGKVIAKEKELIAIIEPEEDRLESIEEEAEALKIKEDRLEKLPARKERLQAIPCYSVEDDFILTLDSEQFEAFYNQKVAEHNEELRKIERAEQERKQAEIKAEQSAKQAELDAKQAEIDKREAEVKAKEDEIRRQNDILVAEDKARLKEQARIEAEQNLDKEKEKEEKKKLERQKKFIAFRADFGWTKENKDDFMTVENDEGYVLWKRLGVFPK